MRRGAAAFTLATALASAPAFGEEITAARYLGRTDAYGHGAVADGEYSGLELTLSDGQRRILRYEGAVFEDTAPRLHDFDGDGAPEVVTVLSGFNDGARVALFGLRNGVVVPLGSTAPIGTRHRWLAIAGIADFDGDGHDEIAYVDRPHLAKTLRLVTIEMAGNITRLTPLATAPGLTNHHIGTAEIEGGVRDCPGALPVVVTADADWARVMETRFEAGRLVSVSVADYTGPKSFTPFLTCPN